MEEISKEMKEKNIQVEFLDIWPYVKDEVTKEVNETELIEEIIRINPQMMFLVICYSQILDLRLILEGSGILSEIKLNRDMKIQSRGKILTMSKTQKEFLQEMAKPENLIKRLVEIWGQVGSGKTLLAIEVVKMKVAYFLLQHGLTAEQGKDNIHLIVIFDQGGSNHLKEKLEGEFFEDGDADGGEGRRGEDEAA